MPPSMFLASHFLCSLGKQLYCSENRRSVMLVTWLLTLPVNWFRKEYIRSLPLLCYLHRALYGGVAGVCEKTSVHFFGNTLEQDVPEASPSCLNCERDKWADRYDLCYCSSH